jgi:hypothetical protein
LNEKVQLEGKMTFHLHDFMTPLQTVLRRLKHNPANIFEIFVTKQGLSHANVDTFVRILRQYINLELSTHELTLLRNTLIAFYGPDATTEGLNMA